MLFPEPNKWRKLSMNAFTHPSSTVDDSPEVLVLNKKLTHLSQSKVPVERLRQYDYFEFADESRVSNITIFDTLRNKLIDRLGQEECKFYFVKGSNIKKKEDGFDTLHYLVGFQSTDRTYATELEFINKGIAE
jgi:hypothetical protein